MKAIRIGMLGYGSMGKTHTNAINNLHYYYKDLPFRAEVASLCTAHPDRAKEIAELYGIAKVCQTPDELINDPDIDVVDICTPNCFHYDAIVAALKAGKHVYCEKPLCVTFEEAAHAAKLARESGKVAQVVFNNRFLSPIMRAKQLIDEGRLGRILSFRGEYLHTSATDTEKRAGWKQNRDICGGGVLFDLGSHVIDLIYYLCGEFQSVIGASQIAFPERTGMDGQLWRTNADEAFYILATLKSGAMGTIEVSKIVRGANDDLNVEVRGEKGAVRFSLMEPNFLWFYDGTRQTGDLGGECGYQKIECVGRYPTPGGVFPGIRAPIGWLRGHIGSMYSFLDAVYANKKPCPDFDDAAHVQWVMDAAYKNDLTKKQ